MEMVKAFTISIDGEPLAAADFTLDLTTSANPSNPTNPAEQISRLNVTFNGNKKPAKDQTVAFSYDPDALTDITQRLTDTSSTPNNVLGRARC